MVNEIEIAASFKGDTHQLAEALVTMVLSKKRPGQDNLTVAILAILSLK